MRAYRALQPSAGENWRLAVPSRSDTIQAGFSRFLNRLLWLMIALPASLLWLRHDLGPGSFGPAAFKLAVVFGVVAAVAALLEQRQIRRWAAPVRRLENFVTALPATEADLPEDGPVEIQKLARSMKALSQRVRRVVERANLESPRREAILACMAEGVLAVDEQLKVSFCNHAFAEAFSARTPVPEGRTLFEVVREPALRDILERVLRTGAPEKDRFQLPTAGSRWFEARALPLGSEPSHGAVIVLHDITDIQNQEQVRKDFVADVSHELRTPLAAIRGYAETLLDGGLEDRENNRKFVEIILSHSIRLANIASDLLVLSELDSNMPPAAEPETIPVLSIVESAIHTVSKAAEARSVTIHYEACRECFVRGFRFRMEQAMVNLLDNAVKFNRPGGEVNISCDALEAGRIRITVADTGIGIPSGDVKRIFERFYRVDKARSRPVGGTGLGLPIVKEVVERMGGTISVESVLGQGSKFTLTFEAA
jgi:two-component system, OmpR family, phosphate regulon sensor histidine kinase PhoR